MIQIPPRLSGTLRPTAPGGTLSRRDAGTLRKPIKWNPSPRLRPSAGYFFAVPCSPVGGAMRSFSNSLSVAARQTPPFSKSWHHEEPRCFQRARQSAASTPLWSCPTLTGTVRATFPPSPIPIPVGRSVPAEPLGPPRSRSLIAHRDGSRHLSPSPIPIPVGRSVPAEPLGPPRSRSLIAHRDGSRHLSPSPIPIPVGRSVPAEPLNRLSAHRDGFALPSE